MLDMERKTFCSKLKLSNVNKSNVQSLTANMHPQAGPGWRNGINSKGSNQGSIPGLGRGNQNLRITGRK